MAGEVDGVVEGGGAAFLEIVEAVGDALFVGGEGGELADSGGELLEVEFVLWTEEGGDEFSGGIFFEALVAEEGAPNNRWTGRWRGGWWMTFRRRL